MSASDIILKISNIESYYGPIMAIRGISLEVPREFEIRLEPREHLRYEWLQCQAAAEKVFSWSNAEAIRELPQRAAQLAEK